MKALFFAIVAAAAAVQPAESVKLPPPNLDRGDPVMKAFSNRHSTKSFSARKPSMADLSDLLFAANGINRPESGKRTAPSALNRQDIKIYVCLSEGSYIYVPQTHSLKLVSKDDLRQSEAPVCLVLVSDFNDRWSGLDAGIVSQNISIFCAGTGLSTYPHTTMDAKRLRNALGLSDGQTPMICNSVGYER